MSEPDSFQKSSNNVAQDTTPVNGNAPEGSRRHIVQAAGLVGGMTLLSRILGMIRDMVSAQAFGTSWQWDAFLYAFMIPNFFRRLVGEGALSSVFIPVYSEILQTQGKEAAYRFAKVLLSVLETGFFVFMILAEIGLAWFLASAQVPDRIRLIADLLRFLLPYLAMMSTYALFMGVLNSHREFFASAFGPVIMNIGWTAGVLVIMALGRNNMVVELRWLAVVTVLSGIGQILFQVRPLRKIGFRFSWIWEPLHPALGKCLRLLLPVLGGFAVMQINLVIDSVFAYWVGQGANSTLWYANRLMQFPLGVFAIAISSALLPTISRQFAAGHMEEGKRNLSFSLRTVGLIVLPCAVGLMVLSRPIIQFLFERGQFDAESTRRTSAVLFCYAFGILPYAAQKVIISGFYARQDTSSPVKISIVCVTLNAVMNAILMHPLAEAGLALSTSISGLLNLGLLILVFHRKISPLPLAEIGRSYFRILLASAAMGGCAFLLHHAAAVYVPGTGIMIQAMRVLGSISGAALLYPLFCFLFRVPEVTEALTFLKNRKKSAPPA